MALPHPDTTNEGTPSRKAPGEFTRMFGAPAIPDDSRPTATFVTVDPNAPTAEIPALPAQEAAKAPPAAEKPANAPARDSFAEFFGVQPQQPAGQVIDKVRDAAPPPAVVEAGIVPKVEAGAAPGQRSPGQFTQQFEKLNVPEPSRREMASSAAEPTRQGKAAERASGQDAASHPSGAFTKLFGAPAQSSTEATPAMSSAPPSQPAGEFTKLFSSVPQPAPAATAPLPQAKAESAFTKPYSAAPVAPTPPHYPVAPAPEAKEAGAFTRLFNMPPPEAPPPQPVRDPLAALQPVEVAGKTPAATQIFVRPGGSVGQDPPPVAAGPSAFTKIIASPAAAPPAPIPAAPAPAAAPPTPPPPGMAPFFAPPAVAVPPVSVPPPQVAPMPMPWPMPPMQVAAAPPQPQIPPPPQAQSPLPAAPINWMPLIVGINVFLLLAIIVILIFALRK